LNSFVRDNFRIRLTDPKGKIWSRIFNVLSVWLQICAMVQVNW